MNIIHLQTPKFYQNKLCYRVVKPSKAQVLHSGALYIKDFPTFQYYTDSLDYGGWITKKIVKMSTVIICSKLAHLSDIQIVDTILISPTDRHL